ncbi:hypothetical protein F4777DRAFT_569771 [Nemania sp. FL0916]|nr:hypothetical protein F4777DRAFT_569771 [Nemania sp. FL0916]
MCPIALNGSVSAGKAWWEIPIGYTTDSSSCSLTCRVVSVVSKLGQDIVTLNSTALASELGLPPNSFTRLQPLPKVSDTAVKSIKAFASESGSRRPTH